jgi:hypothetical protein
VEGEALDSTSMIPVPMLLPASSSSSPSNAASRCRRLCRSFLVTGERVDAGAVRLPLLAGERVTTTGHAAAAERGSKEAAAERMVGERGEEQRAEKWTLGFFEKFSLSFDPSQLKVKKKFLSRARFLRTSHSVLFGLLRAQRRVPSLFSKAWGDGERAALESERGEVQREQKRKKFFDAIIAGIFPSSRIA